MICFLCLSFLKAQDVFEKKTPLEKDQTAVMNFDFADKIIVKTSESSEARVGGRSAVSVASAVKALYDNGTDDAERVRERKGCALSTVTPTASLSPKFVRSPSHFAAKAQPPAWSGRKAKEKALFASVFTV